jgi:uncharacterized membrane protein
MLSRKVPKKTVVAKPSRIISLDMLKGLVAVLMIFGHTAYFVNNNDSVILNPVIHFINIVTFTSLLFASGAGNYFAYLKDGKPDRARRNHILKKALLLLLMFYLLMLFATVGDAGGFRAFSLQKYLELLPARFLLLDMAHYTEFLLPFIIFMVLTALAPILLNKLLKNRKTFILSALLPYLSGVLIYLLLQSPGTITSILSVFSGYTDTFRFPVLFTGLFSSQGLTGRRSAKPMARWQPAVYWCSLLFAGQFCWYSIFYSPDPTSALSTAGLPPPYTFWVGWHSLCL